MTAGEFKSILLPCYRRMYATAFAILRNEDDASDAVQDTFSSLWQRHDSIPIPDSPEAFCYRVVRNACIDRLRRDANRYFEAADEVLAVPDTRGPDAMLCYESARSTIRAVLDSLPERNRRVMELSIISELSPMEIARVTGLTANNVRQILRRGRIKLRDALKA